MTGQNRNMNVQKVDIHAGLLLCESDNVVDGVIGAVGSVYGHE